MAKLIVMTDPHLVPKPETIIGLDPRQRLAQGLAHAARVHPDADRLILMGDLTDRGDAESYGDLRDMLSEAPWPVTMTLGNHDHRGTFRRVFPEAVDKNGFAHGFLDVDDLRLIILDTLDDAPRVADAGLLCADRMAWFKTALDTGQPCLVFMHHPPFVTGFSAMDGIGLQDSEAFFDLIGKGQVAHVFAGHVHRTINANVRGISMTTFKGTCHQNPMLLVRSDFGKPVPEPGAYGIVIANGADVVVHFEDFTIA